MSIDNFETITEGQTKNSNKKTSILSLFIVSLLLFSMVIWTAIDSFKTGISYVAKIKDEVITIDEYKSALKRLEIVARQKSIQLSNEQLKNICINQMTSDAMIDAEMKEMGFLISDKTALESLKKDKNFKDNGKFNADKFYNFLKFYNFTMQDYLKTKKREIFLTQIQSLMQYKALQQREIYSLLTKNNLQSRKYDLISLPKSYTSKKIDISNYEIQEYYTKNHKNFKTKDEAIVYTINASELTSVAIKESDVQGYISRNLFNENTRYTRDINILTFANKKDAIKALDMLKRQKIDFDKVASTFGKKPSQFKKNNIGKLNLSKKLADEVFSTPLYNFTDIVELENYKFAIAQTTKIYKNEDGKKTNIAEIKEKLIKQEKIKQIEQIINSLKTNNKQIADKLLKSGAKKLNIVHKGDDFASFDVFAKKEGFVYHESNEEEGDVRLVMVTKINKTRLKTLEEVKDEITQILTKEKTIKQNKIDFANIINLVSTKNKYESIKDKFKKVEFKQNLICLKNIPTNDISMNAQKKLFLAKKDSLIGPFEDEDKNYVIVLKQIQDVKSVNNKDVLNTQNKIIAEKNKEISQIYNEYLIKKYPVDISKNFKDI